MTAFSLVTDEATLHIAPDTGDWSRVTLELPTGRESLGADAHAKIVARLAAGLAETLTGSTIGMIKGTPVRVVMSLFDEQCTIYAADDGDVRVWFVQRADTTLATTLRLSRACCEAWRAILAK
jgi:hypothetical protein